MQNHSLGELSRAVFNLRRATSKEPLLRSSRAVLSNKIRGIASGRQSFADAALTMYALLSAVNIIKIAAIASHIPRR
jgi:hypothetical protein